MCVFGSAIAQRPLPEECFLKKTNEAWIKEFKKAETTEFQLELIKEKLFSDAIYLDNEKKITPKEDRCGCPIRFGIIIQGKKWLVLDLNENPGLEDLFPDINTETIDRIKLSEFEENKLNRYAVDNCSGVTLYTNSRDLKRRIRKLDIE
ncbi:hypothetical protein DZ858_00640 [Marixanthomonas ophiurae]|uniref:Uncharacterized protein n=1 Tax=Marixanthomonas ophiurae TaxID=387659 RepID=A0A3E1Q918_9FLAO|nr:hypothetical protein DZ858_00640 [Marixanthomonas ophiurae]